MPAVLMTRKVTLCFALPLQQVCATVRSLHTQQSGDVACRPPPSKPATGLQKLTAHICKANGQWHWRRALDSAWLAFVGLGSPLRGSGEVQNVLHLVDPHCWLRACSCPLPRCALSMPALCIEHHCASHLADLHAVQGGGRGSTRHAGGWVGGQLVGGWVMRG